MTTSSFRSFRRRSSSRRSRSELLKFLLLPPPLEEKSRERDENRLGWIPSLLLKIAKDASVSAFGMDDDFDAAVIVEKAVTGQIGGVAKRDIATTDAINTKRRRRMSELQCVPFRWFCKEHFLAATIAGWLASQEDNGPIPYDNNLVVVMNDSKGFSVVLLIDVNWHNIGRQIIVP